MSGSLKNSMQNLKEPYNDINNAVINHVKKIVPTNIENNKQPFFKLIYSANEFLKNRYPDSLFLRIEAQC